jgi:hypothetical protein
VDVLEKMGPQAAPASDALLHHLGHYQELRARVDSSRQNTAFLGVRFAEHDETTYLRFIAKITNALFKIDPIAAAKVGIK